METPEAIVQAGYRYALSLTHHHYEAEDLVQQAWMKCAHRYGRVKNRSMLYTTVRHLFYDQCRRSKIIVFESIEGRDSPLDPPDPSMAPDRAGYGDLDTLLAGLRAEEREALYLNAVEGYTAREIAERTGSPRNTILSLIHRAKHKLARALGLPNGDTNATDHESEANRNE